MPPSEHDIQKAWLRLIRLLHTYAAANGLPWPSEDQLVNRRRRVAAKKTQPAAFLGDTESRSPAHLARAYTSLVRARPAGQLFGRDVVRLVRDSNHKLFGFRDEKINRQISRLCEIGIFANDRIDPNTRVTRPSVAAALAAVSIGLRPGAAQTIDDLRLFLQNIEKPDPSKEEPYQVSDTLELFKKNNLLQVTEQDIVVLHPELNPVFDRHFWHMTEIYFSLIGDTSLAAERARLFDLHHTKRNASLNQAADETDRDMREATGKLLASVIRGCLSRS